ncbi:MAG TPA: hypothetical protein VHD56_02670 [Tepidisphaeraceae bacterium]|nr:hypothetical protein [Tepidisphaeraceae bacterium]
MSYPETCSDCTKPLPANKPARCPDCHEWILGEQPTLYEECFRKEFTVRYLLYGAVGCFREASPDDENINIDAKDILNPTAISAWGDNTRRWLAAMVDEVQARIERVNEDTEERRELILFRAYLKFLRSLANPRNNDAENRKLIISELSRWLPDCQKPQDHEFLEKEIAVVQAVSDRKGCLPVLLLLIAVGGVAIAITAF